jgi:hypothetical protein
MQYRKQPFLWFFVRNRKTSGRKKAAAGKTGCGQGNYAITGNTRLN